MEYILIIIGILALGFAYSVFVASAKPIPGSNFYKVSKDGRVLLAGGQKVKTLRPKASPEGLKVKLLGGDRVGEFFIHDLVAEAHLPNPRGLTKVRHKDGNVRNNKIENLAWCKAEEAPAAEAETK